MAIHSVVLTKCSYCDDGHGEIILDAVAFEALCARLEECSDPTNLAKVPDQKVVLYDRDDPNAGPCKHLVMIALNMLAGTMENRTWHLRAAVDYDLLGPVAKEADPEDRIVGDVWHEAPLLDDAEVERADTPNRVLDIGVEWSKLGTDRKGYPHFQVCGNVAFAENVGNLIEELKVLN